MHGLKITLTAALAVFSMPSLAQVSAPKVIEDITALTTMNTNIINILSPLGPSSSPNSVTSVGASVVDRIGTLVKTMADDTNAFLSSTPLGGTRPNILKAFEDFASVQKDMVSSLISKHMIFVQFGVGRPILGALLRLKESVDTFAKSLAVLAPAIQDDVHAGGESIITIIDSAITTYEQLCIPSPLYPTIQPVCVSV
ncbi:hypothetical protein H072_1915 [Dactylellina haptotyla CBS 200.50]|uniref:Uncharacterized protein n=1 Tax=Dactylellina haptotyla (strain CBS 200.50) TaxID=1284197 RepID=S8C8S9_DACHA|nr:hypothetical protein H072_1915 [Dactylellina haptotyla CBS 200.50]